MNNFEDRYNVREDEKVRDFHRSRRMFCIYRGGLYIAEQGALYSHATWFEKEGWISKENDSVMDTVVRGIVDQRGDVYFYVGYDFLVNGDAEQVFFHFLAELSNKLRLDGDAQVFGGLVRGEPGKQWRPMRKYGKIRDVIFL